MEYKIIEFQPVELRYCLGDGLLRSKTIKNSNLSRDEKVTFHFDPLPNRLCFLADCMFPGRPICIDVLDAGHQDYLGTIQIFNGHMICHTSADVCKYLWIPKKVMIFSIAVVGLAGFGMLSALAHFILRLKTKPARKYKQKIQKVKTHSIELKFL